MKIDLCRLFGVEEGEEFKLKLFGGIGKYRLKNGKLEYYDDFINKWVESTISMNHILDSEIIKIPKKKQFSQETLNFFKCIDKEWEWIAKDFDGEIFIYDKKPNKDRDSWNGKEVTGVYINNYINQSIFDQIHWEDEEPIYIDDYVER